MSSVGVGEWEELRLSDSCKATLWRVFTHLGYFLLQAAVNHHENVNFEIVNLANKQ